MCFLSHLSLSVCLSVCLLPFWSPLLRNDQRCGTGSGSTLNHHDKDLDQDQSVLRQGSLIIAFTRTTSQNLDPSQTKIRNTYSLSGVGGIVSKNQHPPNPDQQFAIMKFGFNSGIERFSSCWVHWGYW